MAERPSERKAERKPVGGDLIIPVAAVAFTLYYFSTIINSPFEAQAAAFFIGSILLALVAVLMIKLGRELLSGDASLALGALGEPQRIVPKRLALFALTVGYLILLPWLGFTLGIFLFLAAAMLLLGDGHRPGLAVGLAAALALIGWLVFIISFETRFPEGPFEWLTAGLV
jgi:hypothetical protein